MSEPKEQPKLDLDLGTAFLPSWAQKSAKENPYAKYEGRDHDRPQRRDNRRRDRSDHSDRSRSPRSNDRRRQPSDRDRQRRSPRGNDNRPAGQGGGGANRGGGRPRGNQERGGDRGGERGGRGPARRHRTRQEIIASLPSLKVSILPDSKGVESLAKQIRMQGRAYPLFDIATLVLKRPDRFKISTTLQPDGKGQPVTEQWRCTLDDSLWLSQAEAIDHVLNQHFDQYYEKLKTETDPPKGNFTFVAQCGISGKILGPPNYHGYQDALRALHAERFSRMNFDAYKDRVKIVREEEVVQKWIDEQSWKTQYKSKAQPDDEPIDTWEALIENFKEHHLKDSLETGKTLTVSGAPALKTPSRPVQELVRFHVEDQRRFPLQVATVLSQMFARQGLQFFKVNRTITHVSVARPKFLDMNETPVSAGVQRIVEFIDATPECTRKKLLDALKTETSGAAPAPATESTAEPSGEEPKKDEESAAPSPASAEETAIITDLHWLIHQGHVIEFSSGKIETAKKPAARPAKSEKPDQPSATQKTDAKTEDAESAPAPTDAVSNDNPEPVASAPSEVVSDSATAPAPTTEPPVDSAPAENPGTVDVGTPPNEAAPENSGTATPDNDSTSATAPTPETPPAVENPPASESAEPSSSEGKLEQ